MAKKPLIQATVYMNEIGPFIDIQIDKDQLPNDTQGFLMFIYSYIMLIQEMAKHLATAFEVGPKK